MTRINIDKGPKAGNDINRVIPAFKLRTINPVVSHGGNPNIVIMR